ncbi:TPA: hypothetical protein ACHUWQ_003241, partial [Shigella flexneri]
FTTSRRFSKGYFGFDILGAIPFHRPTKWVQYRVDRNISWGFIFPDLRVNLKSESFRHPQLSYPSSTK